MAWGQQLYLFAVHPRASKDRTSWGYARPSGELSPSF